MTGAVFVTAVAALMIWEVSSLGVGFRHLIEGGEFGALATAFLAGVAGAVLGRWSRAKGTASNLAGDTEVNLKLAQARHESFWSHSPESLFSVEVLGSGGFLFSGINPAHERLTGLRERDIVGKSPEDCLPADTAAAVSGRYRECVLRAKPITYEETLDLPGGLRQWRTSLVPVRHPITRRIVLVFGSARDITADRDAHEELARLNARLSSILSSVSDCYCVLDSDFRLISANTAALRWAGKEAAAVLGNSYRRVYTPETHTGRTVIRAMERREVVHEEMPSLTKPGRWLKYHLYPAPDGGLAVFFRDVTEIRQAREALAELPRQILASQERERRRIASELHDSTTQHIVAANLNLMRLGPPNSEAEAGARDDIQRSLDEALQELRVFTYLLHPPALQRDGLVATLHTFLDGFGRRAQLQVTLRASPALDELSGDLQRAVFRVVQEALSNTHRHARATRVEVQARLIDGTLFVRISDNGRGMCPMQIESPDLDATAVGVGLPGMRARLRQFGGDLHLRSPRQGRSGAVLVAIVPSARQAESVFARLREGRVDATNLREPLHLAAADRLVCD